MSIIVLYAFETLSGSVDTGFSAQSASVISQPQDAILVEIYGVLPSSS